VYVGSASIKKISKYGRITRGVDVEQSPTVVIADNHLRAETLVGYVDAKTIDQAVVNAFRNTDGLFTDAYLKQVDKVCFHHSNAWAAIPSAGTGLEMKKVDARVNAVDKRFSAFVTDFKAVKAPKKWRKFRAASVADLETMSAAFSQWSATITPKTSLTGFIAAANVVDANGHPAEKRANKRFAEESLFRCGSQFY
jgi:hypothetical protein